MLQIEDLIGMTDAVNVPGTDQEHANWQRKVKLDTADILARDGTKIAGGCTSGNGLSGNAMLSPASLVATMTFFATGIVVTFLTEALIS